MKLINIPDIEARIRFLQSHECLGFFNRLRILFQSPLFNSPLVLSLTEQGISSTVCTGCISTYVA